MLIQCFIRDIDYSISHGKHKKDCSIHSIFCYSTREVGDRFSLNLPRIIKESMSNSRSMVCFCFPLETYHILLSSITLYYPSKWFFRGNLSIYCPNGSWSSNPATESAALGSGSSAGSSVTSKLS
jgi:hypothetical protein